MRHHRRRIVTVVLTMLLTTGGWIAMQAARPDRTPDLVRVSDWQPHTCVVHHRRLGREVAVLDLPTPRRSQQTLGKQYVGRHQALKTRSSVRFAHTNINVVPGSATTKLGSCKARNSSKIWASKANLT